MNLRNILTNGFKLNSNYGLEWNLLREVRDFSDGITWFDFKINYDKYLSDHKPSFELYLEFINFTIIKINIYYLHHREEEE